MPPTVPGDPPVTPPPPGAVATGMLPPADGHKCPQCQVALRRQGTYVSDDGRGRFGCPRCGGIWWQEVTPEEHPDASTWDSAYDEELTEEHFQAVVEADLRRFRRYVPTRQYPGPAESVSAIWSRAGLPIVEGGGR